MKRTLITGVLAAALIATGGTGLYMASAKENPVSPASIMTEQGVDFENMVNTLSDGDFEGMQNFMEGQGMEP